MKIRKMLAFTLVFLGILGMLTGCGAKSSAPMENAADMPMADNINTDMSGSLPLPQKR